VDQKPWRIICHRSKVRARNAGGRHNGRVDLVHRAAAVAVTRHLERSRNRLFGSLQRPRGLAEAKTVAERAVTHDRRSGRVD
jgi:hypothetical protein